MSDAAAGTPPSSEPPTPRPADRRLHRRRRLALLGAGLFTYLLFRLAALLPGVVEWVYAQRLGAALAWPLSRVTGVLPVSVFELMIVAFLVRHAAGAGVAARDLARRRRSWRNALAAGALRLGADLGVVVVAFYVLWGFNYARPPLAERAAFPAVREVTTDELAVLAREAVDAANAAYVALHGQEDAGRPTVGARVDRGPLFDALAAGWARIEDSLGLQAPVGWRFGPPKRFLFAGLFKRGGVSGMYSPFTGEALVVGDLPAVSYPKSAAHEQAHQRGVAHEAEANFLGYLAAAWAPDPHARYSAHVFAVRQLLPTLARADGERGRAEATRLHAGVRRDIDDLRTFWARYEGPLERVGTRVNDAFLRTNRIEEGVVAYSRSVELLIAFARSRAGS